MSYGNASALRWARAICSLLAAGAAIVSAPAGAAPPDLQGIWTGGTLTPFERPPQLGTQLPEADRGRRSAQRRADKFWAAGHKPGEVGRDNDAFIDQDLKILPNGQTSLVVSPPTAKCRCGRKRQHRRDFNNSFDSYETMSQWDRCITREPTTMFPVVYNNAYQIVQTPGYVLIVAEMIHDARIIPIERRAAHRCARALVGRRLTRSLGRLDAGRRDHELPRHAAGSRPA